MEQVTLLHGDALEVLRTLPDNSVDAIVTDPPGGISFMGREWDSDKGGRDNWIAAFAEIARECLRVVKPGAHALVWAIPRTSHWTATAWENGGWEVRDRVAHVFGCLSDDTEIMINGRWEHYHRATKGNLALCYNVEDDTYSWQPIEDLFVYEYEDTAYRIQSDHTDQIVSRNHRCIVERGGTFTFALAEDIARERTTRIPILEGLHDLLSNLPVPHQRTSGAQQDVQRKVQRGQSQRGDKGRRTHTAGRKARDNESEMRGVRQGDLEANVVAASHSSADLLEALQWDIARRGMGETCAQRAGGVDGTGQGQLHAKDERCEQSGMARRGDILPQAWQLQANQVCEMPAGLHQHGTQGWLCDGTSPDCGASDWPAIATGGSGASHQPRPAGQQPDEPSIICDESGAQAIRGTRHTRTDLASITPFFYKGVVWCVKVPTGAFVARRNGKVFVTGNSGFPKSHDVSKAIDKAAGAEREVVGVTTGARNGNGTNNDYGTYQSAQDGNYPITAPATDDAKRWQGWGSALKPAVEDWWLLRKPLTGTIAANVLEWGTGGLNIDATRVQTQDDLSGGTYGGVFSASRNPDGSLCKAIGSGNKGRWPAHLIHDGSDEVVAMFPQTQPSKAAQRGELADIRGNKYNDAAAFIAGSNTVRGHDDNGGSAARFFQACRPDETCSLCCLPCAEASDTIEAWLHLLARTVEKNGWTTQATNGFIARINAIGKQNERLVRNVKSAGNLCDSCAMSIAVALVGIKTSAFSSEELQVILASTGSCENSILIQSLVFFAGLWENTATIPTTTSLSILFGFVHHAIESYIKQGRTAGAGEGNGQEQATLFRYSPKASKRDRDEGLEGFEARQYSHDGRETPIENPYQRNDSKARNHHPTVKPTELMRYLCRLITPAGGVVLDPFAGSGSTGKGAVLEGFNFIGIEKESDYLEIAKARIAFAQKSMGLFGGDADD